MPSPASAASPDRARSRGRRTALPRPMPLPRPLGYNPAIHLRRDFAVVRLRIAIGLLVSFLLLLLGPMSPAVADDAGVSSVPCKPPPPPPASTRTGACCATRARNCGSPTSSSARSSSARWPSAPSSSPLAPRRSGCRSSFPRRRCRAGCGSSPAGAVPGLLPGAGRPTGAGPAHRRVATVPGAPAALALLPVLAAGRRQADDPVRADDLQPSADGLVRPDRRSRPGRPGEARLRLRHAARRHAPAADVQPDPLRLLAQRQQPVAGGGARGAGGLRRGEPGAGGVLAAGTQVQPVADRRPRRPRRRGEPAVVRLQLLPRHCGKPPEPPPCKARRC